MVDRPLPPSTAWRRFRRNRLARFGAVVLGVIVTSTLVTLPFSLRWYNVQELTQAVRHGPSLSPVVPIERYARMEDLGTPTRAAHLAVSWFGHDDLGRSMLCRLVLGLQVSAIIGVAAALITVVVGTGWGAIAGMAGGRIDRLMMRVVDVLYGLPYILMVILMRVALAVPLKALLGGSSRCVDVVILLLAIGSVSWLTMARVIRGQVLSLRSQPFVEAARAMGGSPWHILRRHILPNLVGLIVVYATLVVPQAVLQEAFLSFLGIGIQQPLPSLGRLAADGVQAVNPFVGYWWLIVFPCGLLVVTLLALHFIGDGLRDAFDPKSAAATLL